MLRKLLEIAEMITINVDLGIKWFKFFKIILIFKDKITF